MSTLNPKICARCNQHRALFRYRGRVAFDADHNYCFRCFRSAMDRLSALILKDLL